MDFSASREAPILAFFVLPFVGFVSFVVQNLFVRFVGFVVHFSCTDRRRIVGSAVHF